MLNFDHVCCLNTWAQPTDNPQIELYCVSDILKS